MMANEEKIKFLLNYLSELRQLNEDVFRCSNEIKMVIDALNEELGI